MVRSTHAAGEAVSIDALTTGPSRALSFRPRRDSRSGPPGLPEVAGSAPWLSELVGCPSLELTIRPGHPVKLSGAELARHAGLSEMRPIRGFPKAGELAGLVVLSSVQGMAYVPVSPFPYCKLRAHQLTSVLLHAGDVLELSALSYVGTVQLWVCRAVERLPGPLDGHCQFPLREDGACLDDAPLLHRIEFPMR